MLKTTRLILMLLQLDSGKLIKLPDLIYIPCVTYCFEQLFPDLSHNESLTAKRSWELAWYRRICCPMVIYSFVGLVVQVVTLLPRLHPTKSTKEQLQRIGKDGVHVLTFSSMIPWLVFKIGKLCLSSALWCAGCGRMSTKHCDFSYNMYTLCRKFSYNSITSVVCIDCAL